MAAEVAEALVTIFTRTAFPSKLLSDRGATFMSRVIAKLGEICGIQLSTTSPYRPQGNGVVERLHATLKPMLAKTLDTGDC